jgi:hypothetical protein
VVVHLYLVARLWLFALIVWWIESVMAAPYFDSSQQRAPWTAAASLDAKFVAATKRLFDEGVADPRGCEYRELDIEVTQGWERVVRGDVQLR